MEFNQLEIDMVSGTIDLETLKHEVFDSRSPHYLDFKYFGEDSENPKGLMVVLEASHGFRPTGWNRVYSPYALRDALPSLTYPRKKPVKPTHYAGAGSMEVDPIGRITGGRVIELQSSSSHVSVADTFAPPNSETYFSAIRKAVKNKVFDSEYWAGTAVLVLDTVITDAAAVEKIMDERAADVSIELATDGYFTIEGKDYDPSSDYTGLLLCNRIQYRGVAFATHPADSFAGVKSWRLINGQEVRDTLLGKRKFYTFDSADSKRFGSRMIEDSYHLPISPKRKVMTLEELKALLVKAIEDGITFDKADELYQMVTGSAIADAVASTKVCGFPADKRESWELLDSVLPESSPFRVILDSAKVLLEDKQETPVEDSAEEKPVESLNLDTVKEWLSSPENGALLRKELSWVTNEEADSLIAEKVTELTAEMERLKSSQGSEKLLKELAQDAMLEAKTLKTALLKAIEDHSKTAAEYGSLLDSLISKDAEKKELCLTDSLVLIRDLKEKLDMEKIVSKVHGLGKEVEDTTNVEDPSKIALDSRKTVEYSQKEIEYAQTWKKKLEDSGLSSADSWLRNLRVKKLVSDKFSPNKVLQALENK